MTKSIGTVADIFSQAKRSEIMSRVKGKGNKNTELVLAQLFRQNGITNWRRQYPIVGKPDFAFPKCKLAIFVDGCFWHGCPKHATHPRTNAEFWETKLAANKLRDKKVNSALHDKGWRVLRIWGHALAASQRESTIKRVIKALARTSA